MHLLERDAALASLMQYATEVPNQQGRLVLVAGEAGVGKTALLEEFERRTPSGTWAWGGCDGLYTPRPLGPLFDIAARLGGDLLAACEKGSSRETLFGALLRQIDNPGRLTVLVIEDVHWADEATLDLVRFLARRLRDVSALVIATYRDDGLAADDPLRRLIGEVVPHRTTRRISLPTLSLQAVEQLAGSTPVDPRMAFELTGGNPFYLNEVLAAGGATLPMSARDAALARVGRLSAGARQVLEPAALLGSHLFAHLLGRIIPDAAKPLDECLQKGVLVYDDGGLRFRHEIIRLAVQDAVPVLRRAQLHAALLKALRDADCDESAELAYHAEGAGDAEAVLEYATQAARTAEALGSHREALAQYQRALRFSSYAAPEVIADFYDGVGCAASLVDRWDDAAQARQAALALWRQAGDRQREGDTLRLLSRALWRLCRGKEAAAAAEEALAVLQDLPASRELTWAYANLATQRMLDGDLESARTLSAKAVGLAESLGETGALSDALNTTACAAAYDGLPWDRPMLRALEVAKEARADEQAGRAYANLYALACGERRFAWGEPYFVDGLEFCEAHDITTFATCLRGQRAAALERMGKWDEAVELARMLLARPEVSPVNRLNPTIALGRILARRGDPEGAQLLTHAAEDALGSGEAGWIAYAQISLCEMAWAEGHSRDASRAIDTALGALARCDPWLRGEGEVWLHRLGQPPLGSDNLPSPYQLELSGDLAGAAGEWTRLGCPYDAALVLAHSDDPADLLAALSTFDELGAVAAAALTRQAMRRLGVKAVPSGPRATTREHEFKLTRRENEVLQLLCEGLANSEISQRLFISERTVDHHVSSVLNKMDVRSRGAAARKAIRAGIVEPTSPIAAVSGSAT